MRNVDMLSDVTGRQVHPAADRQLPLWPLVSLAALATTAVWAYWPAIVTMANKWHTDPQYSHGWLVPAFALGILWLRRDRLQPGRSEPSVWGVFLLLAAIGLKLVAAYFYLEWFDQLSIVPCAAAICVAVGGRHALAWAWPAVIFLFFMVPLPHTLEDVMREPLRWFGTKSSTYLMQTIGLPAYSEGFVVIVGDERIGVAEACSGLNMLMTFFALSTAVAILCERPIWERAVILLSAVPIALIANVARVTIVGLLHANGAHNLAETLHNNAALLMMPIALGLLGVELWLLSALLIVEEIKPLAVGLGGLDTAQREPDGERDGPAGTVRSKVRASVHG